LLGYALDMPRRSLANGGGIVFHVLNRGAHRARVFHDGADYAAFERVLCEGLTRHPSRLLAYCLMPNHWHLVIWPTGGELPRLMHWLCMTHAKRWRVRHGSVGTGHVYQGRYRAIPVQSGHYLLTLLRYVERNPRRAGLIAQSEQWRWSSLNARLGATQRVPLTDWPFTFTGDWAAYVNQDPSLEEEMAVRRAIKLNEPLGDDKWAVSIGADTGSRVVKIRNATPGVGSHKLT